MKFININDKYKIEVPNIKPDDDFSPITEE